MSRMVEGLGGLSRSRLRAAGAFTALIVAVLAVIVYVETLNVVGTVTVWVVKSGITVVPGQPFNQSVVTQRTIRGQSGDFSFTRAQPTGGLVFGAALHAGDIVTDDDLQQASAVSDITITATQASAAVSANLVDIYLFDVSAGCISPVVGNVPVVSSTGNTYVIQVSKKQEADWLVLVNAAGEKYKLLVVPTGGTPANGVQTCLADALRNLAPGFSSQPSAPAPLPSAAASSAPNPPG